MTNATISEMHQVTLNAVLISFSSSVGFWIKLVGTAKFECAGNR
jgi:hypothetical protein